MYSYIFDIGGVLIRYDNKTLIEILAQRSGLEYVSIEKLFMHDCLYPIETGRISCQDFYKNHVMEVISDISYEDWIGVFFEHFTENPVGMELLLKLKKAGNDVYILSNLAEFHKIAIERKVPGFFSLCKKNFLSYELGYHKPEAEIYQEVCKGIGKSPANCVLFDDLRTNIEGAEKAGLIGIQFSNNEIKSIVEKIHKLDRNTVI